MTRLKNKIIGTWILDSWTYKDENGVLVDHLGKSPTGMLTYAETGQMSVQIMKSARRRFASGHLMKGTQEEIHEAFTSFFAYFGTYEEQEPGILIHHIEGSNFPNWVGESELRRGKVKDDELVLSAPSILPDNQEVVFEVKWKRADNT